MWCRACNRALKSWGTARSIELLICASCGSIHADCGPPEGDLYSEVYAQPHSVSPLVADSLERVARSFLAARQAGRWLDIGFGAGDLLGAARAVGFEACGSEISQAAIERAKARGFDVASGTDAFADGGFDVVSMVELIEHVEEPRSFLREARRLLRPGGCLYITTPNAWSLNRWILASAWSVFAPPDHITIFTARGLHRLLRSEGFDIAATHTEGLNPFEVARRFRRRPSATPLHRVDAGLRLCQSLSSSPQRRLVKNAANLVLSAIGVGDTIKLTARRTR